MIDPIENEIWEEFNELQSHESYPLFAFKDDYGIFNGEHVGLLNRIDESKKLWVPNSQFEANELIEKVLLGEKKWDQIVDDLPKRISAEIHEPEFRKLNKNLLSVFHTESDANQYLELKRFEHGEKCLKCNHPKIYRCSANNQFKCPECGYKFTAKTRTIFNHTKLELVKWYSALVILKSKNKISSHKLAEILRVTQKTAYWMGRKIKDSINDPFLRELNRGIFEYKPLTSSPDSSVSPSLSH